jgi:hypothetical protein
MTPSQPPPNPRTPQHLRLGQVCAVGKCDGDSVMPHTSYPRHLGEGAAAQMETATPAASASPAAAVAPTLPTATALPASSTPAAGAWLTYSDPQAGYSVQYPVSGRLVSGAECRSQRRARHDIHSARRTEHHDHRRQRSRAAAGPSEHALPGCLDRRLVGPPLLRHHLRQFLDHAYRRWQAVHDLVVPALRGSERVSAHAG